VGDEVGITVGGYDIAALAAGGSQREEKEREREERERERENRARRESMLREDRIDSLLLCPFVNENTSCSFSRRPVSFGCSDVGKSGERVRDGATPGSPRTAWCRDGFLCFQ